MAKKIAMANQKGGVGKTTTTYHLARAALRRGLKVLAVDGDPQGNLTSSLSRRPLEDGEIGLADALSAHTDVTLEEVIVPGVWDGVDLIPTTGDSLALVDQELVIARAGRESRMRDAFAAVEDRYDLVLIDCPPAVNQLTINAMTAADGVVIVSHAALWSLDGIARLLDNIKEVAGYYNPKLRVQGLIVNKYDKRRKDNEARKRELLTAAKVHDIPVMYPVVPERVAISSTAENGEALDEHSQSDARELAEIYDRHMAALVQN